MNKNIQKSIYILLILGIIVILTIYIKPILIASNNMSTSDDNYAMAKKNRNRAITTINTNTTANQQSTFTDNFESIYTIEEDGNINTNNSKWWVNSGAYLHSTNGIGSTVLGDLTTINPWRVAFYLSNPTDTDNGYHPQNIFRLVQKDLWKNFTQEAYFKIVKNNLSESPNRNASNGILLFNRYADEFNLYYTGIRVDGYAVIKKKINSTYYTMAYKPVFTNNGTYDTKNNPNLLPLNTWIGVKSILTTNTDGTITIKVYMDNGKTGNWVLVAEATDNGKNFGGNIITNGYAGIRTDFMDVQFDDYKITAQ